ncbi:hypothetical protein TPB0596_42280 [Tsukamurella pulmonis]|nr:hypothetical protein TPB0596_42280 [Tsukamurella pulmonis]
MSETLMAVLFIVAVAVPVLGGAFVWWRTEKNRKKSGGLPAKRGYTLTAAGLTLIGGLSIVLAAFLGTPQGPILAVLSIGFFWGAFKAYTNGTARYAREGQ